MKKKSILFAVLFIGTALTAQTGKVGINTDTPTEVLGVNGTVRVRELPANGTANAIYTINSTGTNNGTASSTKNQTFTAANTVVVDKNGVLGVVTGLPITQAPSVKSIQYVTRTALIDANTPTNSVITLGIFQFVLTGRNPLEESKDGRLN